MLMICLHSLIQHSKDYSLIQDLSTWRPFHPFHNGTLLTRTISQGGNHVLDRKHITRSSVIYHLHGLYPKDGASMFLLAVSANLPGYRASQPKSLQHVASDNRSGPLYKKNPLKLKDKWKPGCNNVREDLYCVRAINDRATTHKQWNNHSVSIVIIPISGEDDT
jgi:hypothetical protein